MKRSTALFFARVAAICAYAAVVLTPALVIYIISPRAAQRTFFLQVGLVSSLLAFPMLALQPVLSARMKWLDRLFGLDRILAFHKAMAITSGVLILTHPVALSLDSMDLYLFTSLYLPWNIQFGKLGFLVLLVLIIAALLYRVVHRTYERWRWLHNLLALVLLAVGIIHALQSGRDMASAPMQLIFYALLALGIGFYVAHKLIGPARRKKRHFHVADMASENNRVWTVTLKPSPVARSMRHFPGQFQFITPIGNGELPKEEHPFTISSYYPENDLHASTIKESGDFTSFIGQLRPGDRVTVQGPFGRFSYLLYPDEKEFVFMAGGIGITPFMSMLRHMAFTKAEVRVFLFYANRIEKDITFFEELDRMARSKPPKLTVVHVLESPPNGWQHETGRISREMIERQLDGNIERKAFYICGPPPMMRKMIQIVHQFGVPRRHIHWERFAL
jgi:predicted ferric reductase